MYNGIFNKPAVETAVDHVIQLAAKVGISGHAAALRWTTYHSSLNDQLNDAIVIGASSVDQLQSNLDGIEQGPLPEELATAMGQMYSDLAEV